MGQPLNPSKLWAQSFLDRDGKMSAKRVTVFVFTSLVALLTLVSLTGRVVNEAIFTQLIGAIVLLLGSTLMEKKT